MKKRIALFFCVLCLLTVSVFAFAEEAGTRCQLLEKSDDFDVYIVLPGNAEITETIQMGEGSILWISNGSLAGVTISVAPSELYAGMNLADLSNEEISELEAITGAQYAAPVFSVEETPSGNKYISMRSNEADDVETIFTIYQGFFVEITQYYSDFSALTEEDVSFTRQLLYGLEFVTAF